MKNLVFVFIVLISGQYLMAQDADFTSTTAIVEKTQEAWEAPLQSQVAAFRQARTVEEIRPIVAVVERIALSHPDAWLPAYYAAYYNSQIFWRGGGEEACGNCLKQMDQFLKMAEAADENSEVLAVRANYWQAQLQVSSMMAPFYGPKAEKLLRKSLKKDENNPRALYLLAQNIYYTPKMFGGGKDKAMPYYEKAQKIFAETVADGNSLLPSWGKRSTEMLGKRLNKE